MLNKSRSSAKYEQIRIKSKSFILFFLEVKLITSTLILVISANIVPVGGIFNSKGDIYVEMIIDGAPSRKTEIAPKTWEPKWNETFDM